MYHVDSRVANNFTIEKTLSEIFQCNDMLLELYQGLEVVEQFIDSLATQDCSCGCSEVTFFTLSGKLTGIWYLLYSCTNDFEAIHGHLVCQTKRLEDLLLEKEVINKSVR